MALVPMRGPSPCRGARAGEHPQDKATCGSIGWGPYWSSWLQGGWSGCGQGAWSHSGDTVTVTSTGSTAEPDQECQGETFNCKMRC